MLLLSSTSQSKGALVNARDLSGSREKMPLSSPKCHCLVIIVAGHFNHQPVPDSPTVFGSSLNFLYIKDALI